MTINEKRAVPESGNRLASRVYNQSNRCWSKAQTKPHEIQSVSRSGNRLASRVLHKCSICVVF